MLWIHRIENEADGTVDLKQTPAAEDVRYIRRSNSSTPPAQLHFHQLMGILWRRRSLVLSIATIGTIMAAGAALLVAPKYTAMAQLMVQPQVEMLTERTSGPSLMDESIDTHVTLLSSRDHLRRVVESLSKDFNSSKSVDNVPKREATPGRSEGVRQSVAPEQPAGAIATETTTLNELRRHLNVWIGELGGTGKAAVPSLEEFERNTQVNQERRSRIISVAFTSTSPWRAAAFANRIVQCYTSGLTDQKASSGKVEMARLGERIAEAKYEMENATLALQKGVGQRRRDEQGVNGEGRETDEQLHELERQVGVSAQSYNNLLEQQRTVRGQQEIVSPGIEVYSLASIPTRPSSHNPILFIFPAFLSFVLVGSWLAIVLERLDLGLRSERETREALGIDCIGLIPRLAARHATRPDQYLRKEPCSPYTEAIRSAVTALQLTHGAASKVILVTSSVPSEGKTTLALSLAACVAQFDQRVLLLDLGFRRPSLFATFTSDAEATVRAARMENPLTAQVVRLAEVGVDYLSVPRGRFDMLAFLASKQTRSFIYQLRETYDCVIIDGPPLLGVAEARLLSSMADILLLVVKWGSTRRDVVQNALNFVRNSCFMEEGKNNKQLSIISQVDVKKHAQYHYGDVGEALARHRDYFNSSLEA